MTKKILINQALSDTVSDKDYQAYLRVVRQFMEHHSHGANLEKLSDLGSDYSQYSIRAGGKPRLVLIPVKHNGEQYWLWDSVLENHEYDILSKKPKDWDWIPVEPQITGATPLYEAARNGRTEIVQYLLSITCFTRNTV